MSEAKRYVDADKLLNGIQAMSTYVSASAAYGYSNDPVVVSINQKVEKAVHDALTRLRQDLMMAIQSSAQPYSQCMLCVRRDHDVTPPNLS